MYPIKQSTAITVPFFVHDVNGDAVTGLLTGGFTKRISKNGGAFSAMTVTISEMENGWYSIPLSTSHSNTLGILSITFTHASSKQTNLQFRVEAKLNDDLNDVAATDIVSSGAITTSGGAISTATNLTNLPAITTNWLTATGITAGALNSKGDWNTTTPPTAIAVRTEIDTNSTQLAAIVADTGELQTNQGNWLTVTGHATAASLATAQTDLNTITGLDGVTLATAQALYAPNVVVPDAAGTAATQAQVATEISDALNVDAQTEPTGVPAANASMSDKVDWLFMLARNKATQTATVKTVYADNTITAVSTSAVSDDATTFTRDEFI